MIKSLEDARIIDGLPQIVSEQDWVLTISEALQGLHKKTVQYARDSQIYTAIDTIPEELLDVLAVNWKIDWYNTDYSIERKRRIIKTAIEIRRIMGTVKATRLQADSINPGTFLEEWFEYNGTPGTYRLYINISDSSEENPITIYDPDLMEKQLLTAKRWSAHLDHISYMVKHGLIIKRKIESWKYIVPFCGTIYCGEYHEPSHIGWTQPGKIVTRPRPEGFLISPEFTGTLPDSPILGYTIDPTIRESGVAGAWEIVHEPAGDELAGTLPSLSRKGYSLATEEFIRGMVDPYRVASQQSGPLTCGTVYSGGSQ